MHGFASDVDASNSQLGNLQIINLYPARLYISLYSLVITEILAAKLVLSHVRNHEIRQQ